MELYIRKYSDGLAIILSSKGEVVGIFEDMSDTRDTYVECMDSIGGSSNDNHSIHYSA